MRLQLDTSSLTSALPQADSGRVTSTSGPDGPSGSRASNGSQRTDSIAISGPSAALSQLAAERASRVGQLTGAVRADNYRIPASAISGALVAQSFA